MTNKEQICFTVDEEFAKELKKIKEKTGLSLSQVVNLKLKGYEIKEVDENE